jgi:hypothetical protein
MFSKEVFENDFVNGWMIRFSTCCVAARLNDIYYATVVDRSSRTYRLSRVPIMFRPLSLGPF